MSRKRGVCESSLCMKHRLGCFVISVCVCGEEMSIWIGSNSLDAATDMSSLLNLSLWTLWMSLLFPEL